MQWIANPKTMGSNPIATSFCSLMITKKIIFYHKKSIYIFYNIGELAEWSKARFC